MHARSCAIERPIVSVEIGHGPQVRQGFLLAGKLPSVQIRLLRNIWWGAAIWRTGCTGPQRAGLRDFDLCTQIRISAEDFDLVLRFSGHRQNQSRQGENEKFAE